MATGDQEMFGEKDRVFDSNYPKHVWMVRPCEMYYEEHKDCTSLRGRFNRYYQFGDKEDCSQWKIDYNNCLRFRNNPSTETAMEIIASEEKRQQQRLADARGNDIWTYRTIPPKEWTRPVAGFSEKEDTLLGEGQKAIKSEATASPFSNSSCVIL